MVTETANTARRGRMAAIAAWLRLRRGVIAVTLLFALFACLTFFIKLPQSRQWDADVSRFVQRADTPLLTTLCEGLTALGTGGGLLILSLPVGVWLWRTRRPVGAILFPLTVAGHAINIAVKALFNRPRPGVDDHVLVILAAQGSSFPSGHAQAATLFFGFLAVLIAIHVRTRRARHVLIAAAVVVALAICYSRVYLGGHFLSDVVGGIAAGLICLWGWTQFYRRFAAQEFAPQASNNTGSSDG
ncbi:MAG: phosphatase PAP2 family protein [Armatimonadetes bacterium]|nr:phosphatase PAP2 family protein [Armatimonadota bacterium]